LLHPELFTSLSPLADVLGKAKAQVEVIKGLYAHLAEVLKEFPGQYYR
jgi:hypothetical protein